MKDWWRALGLMLAKAKGDERPGHKYIARHPRADGGFWYEYAHHESGESMVHHREAHHLPIHAEHRLADVPELRRLPPGTHAWSSQAHEAHYKPEHDAEHEWGRKLRERWQGDFEGAALEYARLQDTDGGRVLDTDLARELSPEYVADKSQAKNVHFAAGDFIARMYEEKLSRPTPEGREPRVLFMAGGAGSGKSSGRRLLGADEFELVFDTTMSNEAAATKNIERAIEAGREVTITYVYRDPIDAFVHGALPRAMSERRTVPLDAFANTHLGALATIKSLVARYHDDPRVRFVLVDNTRGLGRATIVPTLDAFESISYGNSHDLQPRRPEDVRRGDQDQSRLRAVGSRLQEVGDRLRAELDRAHREGRVSDTVYRGFAGHEPPDLNKATRLHRLVRLLSRRGESSRELLPPPSPNRKTYPFVASLVFQGIPIDLEQRKGDTREGVDLDGKPWRVTMRAHYGEVRSHVRGATGVMGARGMDGDRLDVYVGDDLGSDVVVVVDQRIPETGEHDEQKVMLGFSTVEDALACYRGQYTKPGFYGGHTVLTVDEFRQRIADPTSAGQRLEKALSGVEWCPLSPLLGALLFRSALSKGKSRYVTPDGAEVIALHVLTKAGQRAVKYIKRWKVNGRWRYAYARVNAAGKRTIGRALFDTDHMHVGSRWAHGDGHLEVTEDHGDGTVSIRHSGNGGTERLGKHVLAGKLLEGHSAAIDNHRQALVEAHDEAKRFGNESLAERLRVEAERHGIGLLDQPIQPKPGSGAYGFPITIPQEEDTRGWSDPEELDQDALRALSQATSLAEVEEALRGVKHREFAVALGVRGEVLGVGAGPLHPSSMSAAQRPVGGAHDGRVALPNLPPGVAIVVISHNHAAGSPVSERDVVTSLKVGAKKIRAVTWYGTWEVDTDSAGGRREPEEFAESLHGALMLAWSRAASHGLTQPSAVGTMEAPSLEVAHAIARQTLEEIERRAGRQSAEQLGFELARRRVHFEPAPSSGSGDPEGNGSVEGAVRPSAGGDERRPDGRIRTEPGADPLKRRLVGDLQAVGDHIWGSRKDLASLGRIESSKQLEGMSYADAAAIVTKAKLVTPLDLEDARALGMEPAVAHLFMHMLSTVRSKPDDTAASRAAFVDEVREIQGAMRRVKTLEDFKALRDEMIEKWRSRPGQVRSPHAASVDYPMFSDEAHAEAERLTKETGIEHWVVTQYSSYRSHIMMAQQKPYESLGARFLNTLTESTPGARKDLREAANRALELARMSDDDAWEALKTGPASGKPKSAEPKQKPNTDRGHSTAKSGSAEVKRVGGRPVPDANPARVRETFNLREVDFGQGGYMTQADREHHVKQLEGALHDLVDVLGLPPQQVSFHGRLGVALGARGRGNAAAHYEPGRAAINITKFAGGGALAHEWGHALDNIIAGHYIKSAVGSSKGDAFLTRIPEHSALPGELQVAVKAVHDALHTPANEAEAAAGRMAQIEELTAERKRWSEAYTKAVDSAERERFRHEHNRATKRLNRLLRMPLNRSTYFREAFAKDNPDGKPYWSTPEELFARAFESYVHDKLAEQGRTNTYLTDQRGAGIPGWYPQGAERQRINQAMDALVAHLRASGDLTKAVSRMLTTSSQDSVASATAAFWALLKAAYKRKVPTGKYRTKRDGSQGAPIYRYIYTDEAAVQGAKEGEHINLQRHGGGVHEVIRSGADGVTLRHAKTGAEKRMTHDEFHAAMASAYRKSFDRGAEALVRRYVAAASKIKSDPSDAQAMHAELENRFKTAGVDPEHAKRLVGFLAQREGWHTDAKKALLAIASDPRAGKVIAPRGRQIARAAENLARTEKAKEVGANHVGQAVALRAPEGGFDVHLADLRQRVAVELAHTEALLGAVEAAGDNAAMKRAMVDHATQAMRGRAAQELEHLVDAYPGLRDVPEVERLRVARAKFQALQAERDGERKAEQGGFVGASTIVYVADAEGNPIPQRARYRLVDASRVIASHDPIAGFQQRKDYPEGVQERSYHRDKAEQEKVRRNAQGLKPAYVVNTNPDAVNGPPVMTSEGIVLGGNSRTMSMQLAYVQHPEAAEGLKAHLRDNAHAFGFAKGDVDALERPILVREVELEDKGKVNLGVLVRRYNESFTQGMDPRVDQVARGRMVTQGMLDSVAAGMGRTNDSGDPLYPTLNAFLGSSDGMRFVSELSSSREGKAIIDRRNRSQYVGKDGKLNEDGKTFVERVLVGHVLPDPDLLGDMLPKHVSAIAAVVPHVVGAASKGHDVKEPLKTALDAYAYMRRKGLANVDEFERDSGGFASLGIEGFEQKPKLDALSKPLLNVIATRIDKPTQLAAFFREFATQARRNPAGQASLLGETVDTATLLQGSEGRTVAGQRDMFKGAALWVELDESFGEHLWSSVLAKGGTAARDGETEVIRLPWWLALRFGSGLADLVKAKYVKRVPTGKYRSTKSGKQGAPIYRYFYGAHEGGGVHSQDDMREGASFQHGDGHLHIRGVQDGKLHVVHSKTGHEEHLTHAQLSARLKEHHRDALERHRGRLHDEVAAAKSTGLADDDPRVQKIVEEHKKAGYRADPFSEMQRLADPKRYEEITEREKRMRAPVAPPQAQVPVKTVEASVDANSDNLSSVSWTPDPEKKGQGTFRVKFKNGSTYRAEGVPFADFEAVRDGHVEQSPGKSFNQFIRGKHKLERELEGSRGKTPMGTTAIAAAHKDAEKKARIEDANKRVAEASGGSGSKPQDRTAAELHAAAERAEKDAARYGEVPRTWGEYQNKEAALHFAEKTREAARQAESREAKVPPAPTHADHVAEAKARYGLKGKESDRLDEHEHTRKSKELFEAGEHDKGRRYLREAVKEVLFQSPDRNMSPSSAERHMRGREALRIMKALVLGARSRNSRAA